MDYLGITHVENHVWKKNKATQLNSYKYDTMMVSWWWFFVYRLSKLCDDVIKKNNIQILRNVCISIHMMKTSQFQPK